MLARTMTRNSRLCVACVFCVVTVFCGCQRAQVSSTGPKYSNAQWLQMVTQRDHQPVTFWRGTTNGSISEKGAGCGASGLIIYHTPAFEMEQQLRDNLLQDPMFFLPLFKERDGGLVVTGIYVYDRILPEYLKYRYRNEISDALRSLADHKDSSIRVSSLTTLYENKWLGIDDIEQAMKDQCLDIRYLAIVHARSVLDRNILYDSKGRRIEGSASHVAKQIEIKRRLAVLALDHLNDTHFFIRHFSGGIVRNVVRRRVQTETGISVPDPPGGPAYFDWMRSSYWQRVEMQEQWKQWWSEHGEEALLFAHPDTQTVSVHLQPGD